MSFHVVLPSNSSMNLFPQNSLADFRVRLSKPIVLEEQYEVALEEVVYQQIMHDFEANEADISVFSVNEETGEIESAISIPIQYSASSGLKTLVWCINAHLSKFHWLLTFNTQGYFKFVYTGSKVMFKVMLHPKLAYALGFVRQANVRILMDFEEKSFFPSHLFSQQTQMFIYANIVDFQHVGDAMAPLLRICVVNRHSSSHSERYIRPYYVPVSKSRIEEIHIQVRTHSGDIFPFPSGAPLICKLHFRKKT